MTATGSPCEVIVTRFPSRTARSSFENERLASEAVTVIALLIFTTVVKFLKVGNRS